MDLDACARELLAAREAGALVPPPSASDPGFSFADAYAVGDRLHRAALAAGSVPAGLKLGFTNVALWDALGLDAPFWAPVYDRTVLEPGEVSLASFVAPRLEPEIAVGLGAELVPGASRREIAAALAWAAPAFEIVQCRYPDWVMTPPDALADAGLHGALVVGPRVALGDGDTAALAAVELTLHRDGEVVAKGRGDGALGGPVDALAWALRLPGLERIRAGDVVTTGTLTAPAPPAAGQTWEVTTTGSPALGSVLVHCRA
jgi:2-oxo-3-hexenedioate decarboxylase